MLNTKNFALAGGILWAICMLVLTLLSLYTGYAAEFMRLFSGVYPGYDISVSGSLIGAAYGFIDAFVGLYIFAWLYNKLNKNK